jgi:hypothetical protein
VWVVCGREGSPAVALRAGTGDDLLASPAVVEADGGWVCEFRTQGAAVRVRVTLPEGDLPMIRAVTSVLPVRDQALASTGRDLHWLGASECVVDTMQRGLRSGIVYASGTGAEPWTAFYFQNFTALDAFYAAAGGTPADTVGGAFPELGYRVPQSSDSPLAAAVEIVVSDAFLVLTPDAPTTEGAIAGGYLDRLAAVYAVLPRPEPTFRAWPERAARTLRDVSLSPDCTYERDGRRYLMPYVGDTTKPPESMVQLTALVNTIEYDTARGRESRFAAMLRSGVPSFYDPQRSTVVRWLPGADFGEQTEEHMDHESMDSWYLFHALFNVSRLATLGDATARTMLHDSLPFAMRVGRRFNYAFPIFFNLRTLDIIRAEAKPGAGGESDVAGLYALVMLHAHELFGDETYLAEAKVAAERLDGTGFRLAYQTNTTGFAAEAMLRLYQLTREAIYLVRAELCMANLFDNVRLWDASYEHAAHYRSFFGLFPLRDAPYLAPYEELEAQAKFHEFLALGGDDVRPSLRYLLAEYQKYLLDRGWSYFPDVLPEAGIAEKPRNGAIWRALSVPLEDLQDGREASGQVGQELYGCGLAFVLASRYFRAVPGRAASIYASYPLFAYTFDEATARATFRVGGDARGTAELRVIPTDFDAPRTTWTVHERRGRTQKRIPCDVTPEGHQRFTIRGDHAYVIAVAPEA